MGSTTAPLPDYEIDALLADARAGANEGALFELPCGDMVAILEELGRRRAVDRPKPSIRQLLDSHGPLSSRQLGELLGVCSKTAYRRAIAQRGVRLLRSGRGRHGHIWDLTARPAPLAPVAAAGEDADTREP